MVEEPGSEAADSGGGVCICLVCHDISPLGVYNVQNDNGRLHSEHPTAFSLP